MYDIWYIYTKYHIYKYFRSQLNFYGFEANVAARLQEISSQSNLVTKPDHHNNKLVRTLLAHSLAPEESLLRPLLINFWSPSTALNTTKQLLCGFCCFYKSFFYSLLCKISAPVNASSILWYKKKKLCNDLPNDSISWEILYCNNKVPVYFNLLLLSWDSVTLYCTEFTCILKPYHLPPPYYYLIGFFFKYLFSPMILCSSAKNHRQNESHIL